MKKFVFLLLIFLTSSCFANREKIDSLKNVLRNKPNLEGPDLLLNLSELYQTISTDSALFYAQQALNQSLEPQEKAASLHTLGNVYAYQKNYSKALNCYREALKIDENQNNSEGIAKSYINIGVVYLNLSDFDTSLDFFFKALKHSEKTKDPVIHSALLKNIGSVFWYMKNYQKALEYYKQALQLEEKNNDLEGISASLNNIGTVYWFSEDFDKALAYFTRALKISKQIGDKIIIAGTLNNIGELYFGQKNYKEAMDYFEKSLTLKREINDQNGMGYTLLNIGKLHLDKKDYENAQYYLMNGLELALSIKSKSLCEQYYASLSKVYSAKQNYKEALELFKQYTDIRDSIYSDEVTNKIAELEVKYETEKREKELEILRKNKQINTMKLKRQKLVWFFSLSVIVVLLLLATVLYNRYQLKLRTNNLLNIEINERKNTEKDLQKMKDNLEVLVEKRTNKLTETNLQLQHEITERKRIEEKIKKSLLEKEILLKEVHHRVKNNMQIISSLLNLQASNIQDEVLLQIFKSSQSRIMSMALVHEKLYLSKNFAEINMNDYIKSLLRYLIMQHNAKNIRYKIETNNILLDANTAIPLGLLCNEIISNSMKHAFPNQEYGFINILLQQIDSSYLLTISDDGVGFSHQDFSNQTTNLGIELIESLVKQIAGKLDIQSDNGAIYMIRFKIYHDNELDNSI